MRYIEIDDGLVVKADSVELLRELPDNQCEVYTHHRKYKSKHSYTTILAMLKEGEVTESTITPDESAIRALDKYKQHFAG